MWIRCNQPTGKRVSQLVAALGRNASRWRDHPENDLDFKASLAELILDRLFIEAPHQPELRQPFGQPLPQLLEQLVFFAIGVAHRSLSVCTIVRPPEPALQSHGSRRRRGGPSFVGCGCFSRLPRRAGSAGRGCANSFHIGPVFGLRLYGGLLMQSPGERGQLKALEGLGVCRSAPQGLIRRLGAARTSSV